MISKKKAALFQGISLKNCLLSLGSSAVLAFGLYNIHAGLGVDSNAAQRRADSRRASSYP